MVDIKQVLKCRRCGYVLREKTKCPRCGAVVQCNMSCSGNCLKCSAETMKSHKNKN